MKIEVYGKLNAVKLEEILREIENNCSGFASRVVVYLKDNLSHIDRKYIKEGIEEFSAYSYKSHRTQDRAMQVHF